MYGYPQHHTHTTPHKTGKASTHHAAQARHASAGGGGGSSSETDAASSKLKHQRNMVAAGEAAAAKQPQPAAYRLVAGDELGVLKGVWCVGRTHSLRRRAFTPSLEHIPQTQPVISLSCAHASTNQPTNHTTSTAVVEVPAGPKWDAAAVVSTW